MSTLRMIMLDISTAKLHYFLQVWGKCTAMPTAHDRESVESAIRLPRTIMTGKDPLRICERQSMKNEYAPRTRASIYGHRSYK